MRKAMQSDRETKTSQIYSPPGNRERQKFEKCPQFLAAKRLKTGDTFRIFAANRKMSRILLTLTYGATRTESLELPNFGHMVNVGRVHAHVLDMKNW